MGTLLLDGLAGWGLLSLAGCALLVGIFCVDWRKILHRPGAGKCRYCGYSGPRPVVTEHETQDHVEHTR